MRSINAKSKAAAQNPQLVEVLFGVYRRRILGLLLLHPEQSFHVREIARLTQVPAGSLHRELTLLGQGGLLLRSTAGNQVRYQADVSHPIFTELAGIFRKTAGLADVLREALAPLSGQVRLAFIFGSVAQGKERADSDIDVLVVGTPSFAEVVESLSPAGARLGREVNPVVMAWDAFQAKLGRRDRFVTRIVGEPKIVLIGSLDEPGKPAQDRPT